MHRRWVEILLTLALGILLPGLLFTFGKRSSFERSPEPAPTEAVTDEAEEKDLRVSVLMENGDIKMMDLEAYITGVVLREMPADFEIEALKAQAVVARTYTLRRVEKSGKHAGVAVCTDPSCCQGYWEPASFLAEGGNEDSLAKVEQAVADTEGMALFYNDSLAEATYFSCSGGMTEDAKAVWGTDIPYLQATSSPGEEGANYFTDTVTFTTEEFLNLLGIRSSALPEEWVETVSYTDGGGVDIMRICGTDFKGTELRKFLGLRSTAFVITALGNRVTVTTKGFGHRVGMSQYGADAMAVSGSSYADILTHYYRGTHVSRYPQSD